MQPMEARNYRFPKPQLDELERISKKRGIKEPELMRRALEDFLLKCKREEVPEKQTELVTWVNARE